MAIKSIEQPVDLRGERIANAQDGTLVAGNATTSVFTGSGILHGITIWVDDDAGTMHFTDTSAAAVGGLPNATNKGVTDYAGAFSIPRVELSNGLKMVTASASSALITVWFTDLGP